MNVVRKTPPPADGAPQQEHPGFTTPTIVVAWVGDCRIKLNRVCRGLETHRAILEAEARMRQALDEGSPLDRTLASSFQIYQACGKAAPTDGLPDPVAHIRYLPHSTRERIDRQVLTGGLVRQQLEHWADLDGATGPCRLTNSACRSVGRLEFLVSKGWLPPIPDDVLGAIHGMVPGGQVSP